MRRGGTVISRGTLIRDEEVKEIRKIGEDEIIEAVCPYHITSQSNGHAERNVKIPKDLIHQTNHDLSSKEF